MPTDTRLNALASFGLAPNPYGGGYVAYNPSQANPANAPATTGTTGASYGPGEPPGNLATDTASGNIAAMPNIEQITNLVNQINAQNQHMLNQSRLGTAGQAVQDQLLGDVGAWAKGEISPSTINEMEAIAAQRGGGAGFGVDSPNTNAALMRALGLTSEGLQQQALTGYEGLLAANPSAPLYGAQDQLVTPQTYLAAASEQARLQLEYAKLAAEIAAMNQRNAANRGNQGFAPSTGGSATTASGFPTTYRPSPTTTTSDTSSPWQFQPGATPGGSTVFGGIDTGAGYVDMWNPGGFDLPAYGSAPNYSNINSITGQPFGGNPMAGLPVDPTYGWDYNQFAQDWFDYGGF